MRCSISGNLESIKKDEIFLGLFDPANCVEHFVRPDRSIDIEHNLEFVTYYAAISKARPFLSGYR